ncbi:MAG: PLP-dependent aminotransferase family protein [Spirochaetales bacterium]|nr:PLP-dependent aminotransferase family protein [Spirochaetales bacterium]
MGENIIREILKVVSRPGMISLAGGIPSPESFPIELFENLQKSVISKYKSEAFQYGPTEGFLPLREELVSILANEGIEATAKQIMITSGSQGTLDAIGKILINKGDIIAVESPTYLGALSAFNPYEPAYIGIKSDEEGLIPKDLDKVLSENSVKFIYLIPTFQNPTGKTLSKSRREEIAKIIIKHNALLIEDNPYSSLRYKGENIKPIASLCPENSVYISTLSKIFAPGLRIGYYVAPEKIRYWLTLAKQGIDLHTSSYNQALAAEYISGGYLQAQIEKNVELYKPKQIAMLNALQAYMPKGFTWSKPDGGMFIWVEGPKNYNMKELNILAMEQGVAFVPGEVFFSQKDEGKNTLRLNFTMASPEVIDLAIKKLGELFDK